MNHNRSLRVALCLSLAASASCVLDPAEEEESLGETSQDLYVHTNTSVWPLYATLRLCFVYSSGATLMPVEQRAAATAFFKERVRLTWGAVLPFDFAYRECPTSGTSRDVMIDLGWANTTGGRCAAGQDGFTTPAQRAPDVAKAIGCHIDFPRDWNTSSDRLLDTQRTIIHEFGHLLGFQHEFLRPDAGGQPCGIPDAPPGGTMFGAYDPDSIMLSTYECRRPDQFWLSNGDVVNSRTLYASRTPPTALKDIVWQGSTGSVSIYRMSGTIRGTESFVPDTFGIDYKLVGTGDFDGDGIGDLLWRRQANGAVLLWLLNADGTRKDTGYFPLSTEYAFQGVARFNSDNRSDVLWRSTQTGAFLTWMMSGATIAYTRASGSTDLNWQVKQVGYFNSDGTADLFWRHPNGATAVWLMNDGTALQALGTGYTADATWTVKAAGDFNGDGKSDLFWQNADGRTVTWFMNGTTLASFGSPSWVAPEWQVQVSADVDADGKSDLLWRNTDGRSQVWIMDGLSIRLNLPLPAVPADWNMVGAVSGTINPVN